MSAPALDDLLKQSSGRYNLLKADYDFLQLKGLRDSLNQAFLGMEGVVYTDIDERRNRVVVGVTAEAASAVSQSMTAVRGNLGTSMSAIASEATVFRITEPIEFMKSLQSSFSKPRGGVQIAFPKNSQYYLCTLGFNAKRKGKNGFVTASHCTTNQGGVEGTRYTQPDPNSKFIAEEIADPNYKSCLGGRLCRHSDAAFAKYIGNTKPARGRIAKVNTLGSTNAKGTWRVRNEVNNPGGEVNKVGRKTGRSKGGIDRRCVDINVSGTSFTLWCQNTVDAQVGSGDSGSPVFTVNGSKVDLNGILWGGNSSGTLFVYSPIQNIEKELGKLNTR